MSRRSHVVLALAAVATALASTWPVALHPRDHVVDGARLVSLHHPENWWAGNIGADVFTTVWVVNWVLHGLATQPWHLFDANIFYPAPLALARSEHMTATALLGMPGALLDGPVLAHQSALLVCVALNVWAAGYVVARWSGSLLGGVVGGTLFAVSPVQQQNLVHLQSLGTASFALILFAHDRFGASGAPRWALAAAAALVYGMLSGQYLAYYALVVWAVTAACVLATGRDGRGARGLGRDAAWLALALVLAALAALPFALPYVRLLGSGELPDNSARDSLLLSSVPTLLAYLRPSFRARAACIPAATWALAIIGTAALAAGGRTRRRRLLSVVAIGVVGALISLGPSGSTLYRGLVAIVPGFTTMREPWRAAVIPQLAGALLAGFGAAALARHGRVPGRLAALALLALGLGSAWRGPILLRPVSVGPALPEAYRLLARCGGGDPLLELPVFDRLLSWRDAERVFFSTYHWLPLLNGRSGYSPPLHGQVMALARQLPDPQALGRLRALTGVRWILVHCDRPAAQALATLCAGDALDPNARVRRFAGGMLLHDLGPVPALPRPWPARWPAAADCA